MLKLLDSLQVLLGVVQKHLHDRENVTTLNENKSLSFVLSWISIGLQPKQTIYWLIHKKLLVTKPWNLINFKTKLIRESKDSSMSYNEFGWSKQR